MRIRKRPEAFDPSSARIATSELPHVPSTVAEALALVDGKQWQKAINSELQSLRVHNTWDTVPLPVDRNPLPTRFVFLRKTDANGAVTRYKARLVVKGYLQGMVEQTFAPVVDFTAVRIALAVAVQKGLLVHQMDVRTALLHRDIDNVVYIDPPSGVDICGA